MKPVKIAMMSLTHGHTRKYYQTLIENAKLDWVASCAEDPRAKETYELYQTGVPCYLSADEMFERHPDIEAVDKAGIVCQIELEMHYNPVVHRLKKLIADGAVGKIVSVQ
ncbi:MAG: hypothetical protein GX748_17535, partial [Lentisphaerae bacterium]|nr:hypothetical protein [Lentisphaerota bacterium]